MVLNLNFIVLCRADPMEMFENQEMYIFKKLMGQHEEEKKDLEKKQEIEGLKTEELEKKHKKEKEELEKKQNEELILIMEIFIKILSGDAKDIMERKEEIIEKTMNNKEELIKQIKNLKKMGEEKESIIDLLLDLKPQNIYF